MSKPQKPARTRSSAVRRVPRYDFSHLAGAVFTEQQAAARETENEQAWNRAIDAYRAGRPLLDPSTAPAAMRLWDQVIAKRNPGGRR
jgi:hypothetical protein